MPEWGEIVELPERKVFTVSELTEQIRELLVREYPSVWIQGEVSNFRAAPSGHLYFTLKDDFAQIRCVMFKIQSRFLKFRLENGLHVMAWGRLSVYSLRGEYQLILDTMEPLGLGSLMLAFEQLKTRLAAEGLFDRQRKKPLPRFPRTVGLVTSARGAAVRDMIRTISRRSPGTNIVVSPASVQGDRAPEELVEAIERLCAVGGIDVVIIGRGGGAMEDLWAFNHERVVRAVAECPLPIVSAVGHETDVTLTDFAADLRASTPSVSAEVVVPDRQELAAGILHLLARLRSVMFHKLSRSSDVVTELVRRLFDPRRQIQERRMTIDDLTLRLANAMTRRTVTARQETRAVAVRLKPGHILRNIQVAGQECKSLWTRLSMAIRHCLDNNRTTAENLASHLDGLSPLAVLARGYSITLRPDTGRVITDSRTVRQGDSLHVRLHRGRLTCTVTDKESPED